MPRTAKARTKKPAQAQTRPFVRQTDIPKATLEEAVRVPQAIVDQFGGRATAPHRVADAVGMSQTSSSWRYLSGAAVAYGLTTGGYNADSIGLDELGRRIAAPRNEDDPANARVEAALRPRLLRAFMDQDENSNFPDEKYGKNVLADLGVPLERAGDVFSLLEKNGVYAGILFRNRSGRLFVDLKPTRDERADRPAAPEDQPSDDDSYENVSEITPNVIQLPPAMQSPANDRVFITHGKNKRVVEELKKLVSYTKLVPVVAQERESTAIPVPDKVFDDMRKCFAGIIHVAVDEVITDAEGVDHLRINENVLIEIGAAMALYRKNVILLAQEGLTLPSNLQGLYLCKYSGDGLDHPSTMKLLEALSQFEPA